MRSTITLGIINGKHVVLKAPSENVTEHKTFLRELTNKGGKIVSGKKTEQASEAVVLHSHAGILSRRKFG